MSILDELSDGDLDPIVDASGAKATPARTLTRALLILQVVTLHDEEPMPLAKIARKSGLPKPTVHRLVGVLRDSGMLQQDDNGCYLPGPMLLVMGTNYLRKIRLREVSRNALVRLHRATSQAVFVGVPQSPWVVNIARIDTGEREQVTDHVGSLSPQHTTAAGKVLLAFGDSEGVRNLLRAGLTPRTPQSISDRDGFLRELRRVFEVGYATEMGENEDGVVSIAAPIFNQSRRAIGAIGLSAAESQLSGPQMRTWASEVKAAASRVSGDLGWSGVAYGFHGERRPQLSS